PRQELPPGGRPGIGPGLDRALPGGESPCRGAPFGAGHRVALPLGDPPGEGGVHEHPRDGGARRPAGPRALLARTRHAGDQPEGWAHPYIIPASGGPLVLALVAALV